MVGVLSSQAPATLSFLPTFCHLQHNIGSVLCSLCEDAVAEAEAGLSANATAEAVEKAIGDVCKYARIASSFRVDEIGCGQATGCPAI